MTASRNQLTAQGLESLTLLTQLHTLELGENSIKDCNQVRFYIDFGPLLSLVFSLWLLLGSLLCADFCVFCV